MKQRSLILVVLLCAATATVLPYEHRWDAIVSASPVRLARFQVTRSAQGSRLLESLTPNPQSLYGRSGFSRTLVDASDPASVVASFSGTAAVASDPSYVGSGFSRTVAGQAAAPAASMRIVSTSPSITESLFALGLGPRVVGVSNFCQYPPETSRLARVGSFLRPDVELIARLRPDLVLLNAGPHQAERQLAGLGIRAVTVDPGSLASVYSTIRTIGEAAGVPDRADGLVAELRQRLNRVRASVAGRSSRKVLVIVSRRTGMLSNLVAVGGKSYLGELVGIAGGTNVLSDDSLPEYPRISMETVIRLAPDVIVDAADMGDSVESRRRKQPETLAMWRRETAIAAVQHDEVHVVSSDAFVVPGPRLVEATETFAQWFHRGSSR